MTDTKQKPVRAEKISYVLMYIEISAVVHSETPTFEPADKRRIPMPESLPRRRGIVIIREIVVPWPAADTPARAVQGQLGVSSGVQATARIAELIIGVISEQREFV
jgi:hypothetical protein